MSRLVSRSISPRNIPSPVAVVKSTSLYRFEKLNASSLAGTTDISKALLLALREIRRIVALVTIDLSSYQIGQDNSTEIHMWLSVHYASQIK